MSEYLSKNIISTVDQNILDRIHSVDNFQNKLKKRLLKFELGQNTNIDGAYTFNIWCTPQTDGAGDFNLIKKIAKELLSYGIPYNKLNFIVGTNNLIGFLRILDIFYSDINKTLASYTPKIYNLTTEDINLNNLLIKLGELKTKIDGINRTLNTIHIMKSNFANGDKRIKTLFQNIATNYEIDNDIFNKQVNYDFFSEVRKALKEEGSVDISQKLSSFNTYIEQNVTGDKFGILIKFIFQNILKEFPGANIYIFDTNNYKDITDNNTTDDTHNNEEQTVRVNMAPDDESIRDHYYMQIARNCRFDDQVVQTINLQLLTAISTQHQLSNVLPRKSIFSDCDLNKVFYLNEGGNIIYEHMNYQNCLGIGKNSLGIFKATSNSTKEDTLIFLNTHYKSTFEPAIENYHIVYVGQVMEYEINKPLTEHSSEDFLRIFTIQRVFLFLKLLKHKYKNEQNKTIHVFILNVFETILDLHNTDLSTIFTEYNHEQKTFLVNDTTKLQLKFFSRIDPELYFGFVKHSEPILYTTGDQSYQEALSFGKLVFHDYFDHRMDMVDNLSECYNIFTGQRDNNYRQFCHRYLRNTIYLFNFEENITRFFSNRTMIDALNNCLNDYFNEQNHNNNRFYEFYMKYYDFSKEFKKIIFLMQKNALNSIVREGILISSEFNQDFARIDDASYKKKYLKYKQKYTILKNKVTNKNIDIGYVYNKQ